MGHRANSTICFGIEFEKGENKMSMNLHCKEIELWQTPTYITDMCMCPEDSKWEDIRNRYILWVNSQSNGVWDDESEYNMIVDSIQNHVRELLEAKSLNFYVM